MPERRERIYIHAATHYSFIYSAAAAVFFSFLTEFFGNKPIKIGVMLTFVP